MNRLISHNGHFAEKDGKIVLLRGVNLSGSSKLPYKPDGNTALDQTQSFQDHRNVSFVGRPFPLEEADVHFSRMKKWGINLLRLLTPWEAVEHSGPGIYDEEYIEYIGRIVEMADKYGMYVFLDPHQDVWSRFTGGDGAPGWTLEATGMDVIKIPQGDFAVLQHVQGERYKQMSWPLNYAKYPTATMFTLFFGGNVYAPRKMIGDESIQDYLQSHYIAAMCKLAVRVSKLKNVIGFDSLNEPSAGWIGVKNLKEYYWPAGGVTNASSPFHEMRMSEGLPVKVPRKFIIGYYKIPLGSVLMNPRGIRLWKKGQNCVWREHGVWDYDPNGAPMLLKPDYFSHKNNSNINFFDDFMSPFLHKFKVEIQKVQKQFFIFLESDPNKLELEWKETPKKGYSGVVNATHWYDGMLLFSKRYIPWLGFHSFSTKAIIGKKKIEAMYLDCIAGIQYMAKEKMHNAPTVIGETGIPMDLEKKLGYRTNDYSKHDITLNRIYQALEKTFVNVTLWNYTSDNTHKYGDNWNGEDLSIYSRDTDPSYDPDGGRGVRAFSRPYPKWTMGYPINLSFDMNKSLFKFTFESLPEKKPGCAIYIPPIHYGKGFDVVLSSGRYEYREKEYLLIYHGDTDTKIHGITITPKSESKAVASS
ncbi:MAG: cellulase family glycosylhydrolase [Leptospiraceae bacterium]|nr:cellulase family glycosylhydrolase [Leptospiraceae bacterium]MCP5510808.1 cellulase family glycosylhydrolase [Leptospiraceae bacterium]